MNERKTENLLEQDLIKMGFDQNDWHFQGSENEEIQNCLPSKRSNSQGKGKPEHIIKLNGDAADIIVTECKRDIKDHTSKDNLSEDDNLKASKFAEDGIIHYMKGLRKEFNVIGLAVSGTEELKVTTFKALRGGKIERVNQSKVLTKDDYLSILKNTEGYGYKSEKEILNFARTLHDFLRDEMELSEAYKPLIVSGILLALKDTAFERSYRDIPENDDLADAIYEAIKRTLRKASVKEHKFEAMMANYLFIKTHKSVVSHLRNTISKIYRNLFFALQPNTSMDLLGNFYGEFLRYSGGDKQGLGIVLTPRHITDLFSDIADLQPNESVVIDICAGTAGFLIAAMTNLVEKSAGDSSVIKNIKEKRLVGVELDPHMYTLACANMIFKGDGRANIYMDDCLNPKDPSTYSEILDLKPNVALLNPPYSKKAKGKHELDFVKKSLDMLDTNGIGIAIIPVSCVTDDKADVIALKKKLLEKHTLKAVMSMPSQLFPNVGTVTAIIVFEAHKPHFRMVKDELTPKSETWFGYWRDDGFELNKNKRVEREEGLWERIKEEWLDAYFNQRVVAGKSCKQAVSHNDEWIAEKYLETDYSEILEDTFSKDLRRFALYNLMLDI